ncbi:class I SAM-dependent methyltransferase [Tannockella kyphosi]|uniref:class I SAM-dependent methyltransferase n=1 Tax=Tannockella kyphosi TaxID=2899121 RepID=UPI0020127A0E|nr:class I SAM-dependent methyltransferase [Tannockella kyphosi]
MKHYYTDNTDLESKPTSFTFQYKDKEIKFTSDIGVFSKTMIDYGSRVLLDAFELKNENASILDVGCGYGTFGISLKVLYPQLTVTMVDVNDRALSLCQNNAIDNDVQATIFKSFIYQEVTNSYDYILTNPPIRAGKEVVHEILEKSINHLNEDGELWVVIQKKQGAPSAMKKMEEVFGNCKIIKKDKGYNILCSKKSSNM